MESYGGNTMNPLNQFFFSLMIIPFISVIFGICVKVINSIMTRKKYMEV